MKGLAARCVCGWFGVCKAVSEASQGKEGVPRAGVAEACGGAALLRLPVERSSVAVDFLHARGGGVMDLIAHFWDRLARTPPLQRGDLHLLVAASGEGWEAERYLDTLQDRAETTRLSGAMLYVPKAHRADVLALDEPTAHAFARYIARAGGGADAAGTGREADAGATPANGGGAAGRKGEPRAAIDFLTGGAAGVETMTTTLLPLVGKRAPSRHMTNLVMTFPADAPAQLDVHVRPARDGDLPTLARWRRLYKEERGIVFDADLDAAVDAGRVFVYEQGGHVMALGKFDLELTRLVELGGIFTFPEFRKRGCGARLMGDLAARVRAAGKIPTLQVDRENAEAVGLYHRLGWRPLGELARVWLTG